MTPKEVSEALHELLRPVQKITLNAELIVRDGVDAQLRAEAVRIIREQMVELRMQIQTLKARLPEG